MNPDGYEFERITYLNQNYSGSEVTLENFSKNRDYP